MKAIPHFLGFSKFIRSLTLSLLLATTCGTALAQSITNTISIPLVVESYTNAGASYEKLGIWLSIGGGAAPQLFELDTGGQGFYAAYASSNSPWWGTNYTSTGTPSYNEYGSGLQYAGSVVASTITFYSNSNTSSVAIATTNEINIAQSTNIFTTSNNVTNSIWPGTSAPVDGNFYGDFGLNLNGKGITNNNPVNPLAQLTYGNGIMPGYIVTVPSYGSTNGATLQLGISSNDIARFQNTGNIFPLAGLDTNNPFPNTTNIYSASNGQAINGILQFASNNTPLYTSGIIGINLDTGNPTPGLHNPASGGVPTNLITSSTNSDSSISSGLSLTLSSTNTAGDTSPVFSLSTGTNYGSNYVYIETDNTTFYLNAGINAFYGNQVMYNLAGQTLGITQAVPEPSTYAFFILGIGAVLILLRRRRS